MMSKWINCEEQMPKEGQLCFGAVYGHDIIIPLEGESITDAVKRTMYEHQRTVVCQYCGEREGWWHDGGMMIIEPKFWQPVHVPRPPKLTKDGVMA